MNNDATANGKLFFRIKNADELVNVAKSGRNRISPERKLLLETFNSLEDTQFFEYPCEGDKSVDKTKAAIVNFLKLKRSQLESCWQTITRRATSSSRR